MLESLRVPAVTESVMFHMGSSGPAPGSWIARGAPDIAEKIDGRSGTARSGAGGTSIIAGRNAVTSEVLPCRIGRRGGDDWEAGGCREWDREDGLPARVGRHVHRSEPVVGFARPSGWLAVLA